MPSPSPSPQYVELHAASAFSFLRGASLPEDLLQQAAALGLPAAALVDVNGVYGAPRFYQEAKRAVVRAAEPPPAVRRGPLGLVSPSPPEPAEPERGDAPAGPRLTVLVESRTGYRNLCRLLTSAALGRPKGEARTSWEEIAEHAAGLHCLTGGDEGPVGHALAAGGLDAARRVAEKLAVWFGGRVHVELQRHRLRA